MSMSRGDAIAVVEAAYHLEGDEPSWAHGVLRAARPLIDHGLGVAGYHIDRVGGHWRFVWQVHDGIDEATSQRLRDVAAGLDRVVEGTASITERLKAGLYRASTDANLRTCSDRLLLSEFEVLGPRWFYTLNTLRDRRVRDLYYVAAPSIDGNGATFLAAGMPHRREVPRAERDRVQMLQAHIKAGLRLRRRLHEQGGATRAAVQEPRGGAILDARNGAVVQASEQARAPDVRESLREAALRVDRARTVKNGRSDQALALWRGLVNGEWSLVEQFDTDGKRFMVAHRNAERVRDPRALTPTEARVAHLAARGYGNEHIAYHLGVSEAAVAGHLQCAMRKLRLESRVHLVRLFGRSAMR